MLYLGWINPPEGYMVYLKWQPVVYQELRTTDTFLLSLFTSVK